MQHAPTTPTALTTPTTLTAPKLGPRLPVLLANRSCRRPAAAAATPPRQGRHAAPPALRRPTPHLRRCRAVRNSLPNGPGSWLRLAPRGA